MLTASISFSLARTESVLIATDFAREYPGMTSPVAASSSSALSVPALALAFTKSDLPFTGSDLVTTSPAVFPACSEANPYRGRLGEIAVVG